MSHLGGAEATEAAPCCWAEVLIPYGGPQCAVMSTAPGAGLPGSSARTYWSYLFLAL